LNTGERMFSDDNGATVMPPLLPVRAYPLGERTSQPDPGSFTLPSVAWICPKKAP
jgi:hypothetical protein